jgi:membrane fusion protein (multidrug efflux system)
MPPKSIPRIRSHPWTWIVGGVAALVVASVVISGIAARSTGNAKLRAWTDAQAIQTVAIVRPDSRRRAPTLDLPGRLEAYSRAPIYARVSGYIKSWNVDIGMAVKAGQVLAEIEAPDLDQQLLQAQADLANAEANAEMADRTLRRRQLLLSGNVVSQQEVEDRTSDSISKKASVRSARANADRLGALAAFKNIVAPFDGVVTARDTDIGALINGGGSTGIALFVISRVEKLRAYVNVPQNFVRAIKNGAAAKISVPEQPGRVFPAIMEASAQAVDVSTGTTRMQLTVDNKDGALMPGAYANVRIELDNTDGLYIPSNAVIFDQNGLRVATVGMDGRVVFKQIAIARDLGKEIEVASGLTVDDRVIVNPPDGVEAGDEVHVLGPGGSAPPVASETNRKDRRSQAVTEELPD